MVSNDQLSHKEHCRLNTLLKKYFPEMGLDDTEERQELKRLIERSANARGVCQKVFLKEQKGIFQRAEEAADAGNFEH